MSACLIAKRRREDKWREMDGNAGRLMKSTNATANRRACKRTKAN